jgi:hypothetical protein
VIFSIAAFSYTLSNSLHATCLIAWAWRYISIFEHQEKLFSVNNLTDAYRVVKQIEDKRKAEEQKRREALIVERIQTGEKPKGWDRPTQRTYKKQQDDRQYEERKEEAFKEEPKRAEGLFEQIIAEAQKDNDIELDDMRVNAKQGKIFQVLEEYIEGLPTLSEQLEATHNLIKKLKRIAIECQKRTVGASN